MKLSLMKGEGTDTRQRLLSLAGGFIPSCDENVVSLKSTRIAFHCSSIVPFRDQTRAACTIASIDESPAFFDWAKGRRTVILEP